MKNLNRVLLLALIFTTLSFTAKAAVNDINGLTAPTQYLIPTTTDPNLSLEISSSTFSENLFKPIWQGILSISRGGTGTSTHPGDGEWLMGNGTGNYIFASLIQGLNAVITNLSGAITIGVTSTPSFTSIALSQPLAPSSGGTGVASFSKGDILVAQDSTTLVKLPIGQDGQVLMASSSAPLGIAWVSLPSSSSTPAGPIELYSTALYNDSQIQSYYRFNDANDNKNSNNLTNNGLVAFDSGYFGNAADFGTNNNSKYFSGSYNYNLQGSSTVSLWLKMFQEPALNSNSWIYQNDNNTAKHRFQVLYRDVSGTKQLAFQRTNSLGSNTPYPTYNITLGTTNWYYLTFVYDGSVEWIYVNGLAVASTTAADSSDTTITTDQLGIGREYGGGNYLNGLIDDLAVFSRSLTSAEISGLYNGN